MTSKNAENAFDSNHNEMGKILAEQTEIMKGLCLLNYFVLSLM